MKETREELEQTLSELRRRLEELESPFEDGDRVEAVPHVAEMDRMLDGLADSVFLVDRETIRFLDCNRAAVERYGYSREDLRSMSLLDLHPQGERSHVLADLQEITDRGPGRYTHLRRDGSRFPVELETQEIVFRDHPAWIAVSRDISERLQAEEDLRQSERRLSLILETLPLVLYTARGPMEGGTTWVSERVEALTGFPASRFIDEPSFWTSRLHPEDRDRVLTAMRQVEETGRASVEYRWLCHDGSYRWFLDQPVLSRDASGEVVGRMGAWVDISERKLAELALKESEEKFSKLFQSAHDGILVLDLTGVIIDCNDKVVDLLGWSHDELVDRKIADLGAAGGGLAFEAALDKVRDDGFVRFEVDLRRRDGQVFVAEVSSSLTEVGGRELVQGIVRDVTARKSSEAKLQHDALHDPLTGLANRSLFLDRLQVSLDRFRRRGNPPFAIVFLDLDRFKEVNDRLGHHVGDQFLVALARRMEEAVRPGDTVARLHGDEFTLLLGDVGGLEGAVAVAERLQARLSAPLKVAGHELRMSASMGITLALPVYRDVTAMVRDADAAMYRAKQQGGACYAVVATGEGDDDRLHMEEDLKRAIDRGEFQLLFQPVIRLDSGAVCELEALVRWHHPRRGLLTAGAFLSHAEATGLVSSIGDWVLRDACRAAREWRRRWPRYGAVGVSVNLFSRQACQPDLPDLVAEILKENELVGSDLSLEVTEDVILEAAAADVLVRLRERGVRVWLDDFGTGYSSVSSLHQLPIDGLKIDRSFIAGLTTAGSFGTRVVRTVVLLAREIGVGLVAEGVETPDQLAALQRLGVETAQGNYLSPPVTVEGLAELAPKSKVAG